MQYLTCEIPVTMATESNVRLTDETESELK